MATRLIHIPLFFPFPPPSLPYPLSLLPSLPPELPPMRMWDRSHSLLCCIAFARGHRETAENLYRYSRPFNRVCPQSNTVSEKWPPAQRFDAQVADRRSPIQVLTQRKAAWLGWSPGTGHLPHTKHCRSLFHYHFPSIFHQLTFPQKFTSIFHQLHMSPILPSIFH